MKEMLGILMGVLLGGAVGNVVYVHTWGTTADYHWVRSFVFSALFAAVLILIRVCRPK